MSKPKTWLIMLLLANLIVGFWCVFWPRLEVIRIIGCINFLVAGGLGAVLGMEL